MLIHEVGKIIAFNDADIVQDIFASLNDIPETAALLQTEGGSFKSFFKKNLSVMAANAQEHIQQMQAPKALGDEATFFANTERLEPNFFLTNFNNIVSRIPETSYFFQEAQEFAHTSAKLPAELLQKMFLRKWKEALSHNLLNVELTLAESERERVERDLKSRLKIANIVEQTLRPSSPGRLWDLSSSRLIPQDLRHLKHYAQFLGRNHELQQIAAELGRAASNTTKKIKHLEEETFTRLEPENISHTPENISGLRLGSNLMRTLPAEYMYLGECETEIEFYRKFAEDKLLNYEFNGIDLTPRKVHSMHARSGELIEPKGPFIVAIDTSGSMSGYPEEAAKALCLALLQIAYRENRAAYVIMFSTGILTFELTNANTLDDLVAFLSRSFKGGTDFDPCMTKAVQLMQSNFYKNADMVVISDFIAQRIKQETADTIMELKKQGNRFNAIKLSKYGKTALMHHIFDAEWTFDTGINSRLLRRLK